MLIQHLYFIYNSSIICLIYLYKLYKLPYLSQPTPLMYIESPFVRTIKSRMAAVHSLDQLTFMDLSDIKTTAIPHEAKTLFEMCKNLYQLNLSGCGLQSLDNLPNIDLTVLLISSNKINDQELDKLSIYQASL